MLASICDILRLRLRSRTHGNATALQHTALTSRASMSQR